MTAFVMGTSMTPISRQIWDIKYRFKQADGTPVDDDAAASWARVALALAQAEKRRNSAPPWPGTNSCLPGASWPGPAPVAA